MSGFFSLKRFLLLGAGGALLYFAILLSVESLQGSALELQHGAEFAGANNVGTSLLSIYQETFAELFFRYGPNSFRLGVLAFTGAVMGALLLFQSQKWRALHTILYQVFLFFKAMPAILLVLFVLLFFADLEVQANAWISKIGACVWGFHSSFGIFVFLNAQMNLQRSKEYVKTARAKGLSENAIFYRHMLRNILPWVLLYLLQLFGGLIAGVYLLEIVLDQPGLGFLLNQAVQFRDAHLAASLVLIVYLVEAIGLSFVMPFDNKDGGWV